jgi:hypothetical protein
MKCGCRDVAQLGRALRSGRRSRAFKSRHPDHFFIPSPHKPVKRSISRLSLKIVSPVLSRGRGHLENGQVHGDDHPADHPSQKHHHEGLQQRRHGADRRIHLIVIEIGDFL